MINSREAICNSCYKVFYLVSVRRRRYSYALMNFNYADVLIMKRINYNYAYARQV